ncbi:MAG: CDP-alcohol phosphatidyltransferase family protein [Chlamydiae bacterium]|nr:CDP-alcohol phosphatidyltransferase family protein [Chlamydiota bacterium]
MQQEKVVKSLVLGKVLDPMADSIVRNSMLITLTQGIIQLPILLILVFIYRDAMISTLRIVCALKGTALSARTSGKIKAVLQAIVIFLIVAMMIPYSINWISLALLQKISFYSVLIAAIYTVASGLEYLWVNRQAIKKAWVKS